MLQRLAIVGLLVAFAVWLGGRISERTLPQLEPDTILRPVGVYHVHTTASRDSSLTLDHLAQVAHDQGLAFVVVTDHDNQLAAPVQIDGVTILSYAELSTPFGNVVQLGAGYVLPEAQRQSRDIHTKIRALGGVPMIAHPTDSDNPWSRDAPMQGAGGLEIANLGSSARRQAGPLFVGLLPALLVWRFRPALAWAQTYDRDDAALARWDAHHDPGFVGLCASGTHGRFDLPRELAAWRIVLNQPLPPAGSGRAAAVVDFLTQDRFHCVAGLVGYNPRFTFVALKNDTPVAQAGDSITADRVDALYVRGPTIDSGAASDSGEAPHSDAAGDSTGEPPTADSDSTSAAGIPTLVLLRNGQELVRTQDTSLEYDAPAPGTYRVEVRVPIPNVLFGSRLLPVIYSGRLRIMAPPQP